jgi:hypothetical protein
VNENENKNENKNKNENEKKMKTKRTMSQGPRKKQNVQCHIMVSKSSILAAAIELLALPLHLCQLQQ